jgi:ABC-type transport system involved in Fe-S cluster assembly fused permease/ATPase subunit
MLLYWHTALTGTTSLFTLWNTAITHNCRNQHTQFKQCTVIMVAHRLRTVIDCDKVLVLERGRVTEQSHPHELLQQQGPFSSMVAEGGPEVTVYFNCLNLYLLQSTAL